MQWYAHPWLPCDMHLAVSSTCGSSSHLARLFDARARAAICAFHEMVDFRDYCPHGKQTISQYQRIVSEVDKKLHLTRTAASAKIKAACVFADHPDPAVSPVIALGEGIIEAGIGNLVTGPGNLNWAAIGMTREYFAERTRIILKNSGILQSYTATH